MSTTKGALALALVGGLVAILKMMLQARQARQAAEDKLKNEAELAKLRRDADERAARHVREEAERVTAAAERKAEHEQKEKFIAQLQEATKKTLDVLQSQIGAQEATNARAFEMLDRNTQAIGQLAESVASLAQDSRTMTIKVAEIASGAGCRAERRAS